MASMGADSKLPPSFSIPRPPRISSPDTSSSTSIPSKTFVTPDADDFQRTFNPTNLLPSPTFLTTPSGRIALYTPSAIAASLPSTTSTSTTTSPPSLSSLTLSPTPTAPLQPTHRILLLHGLSTPALGLLPLTHTLLSTSLSRLPLEIALLDLPGHGLSSTPLQPHTPTLLHAHIHTVLSYLGWTRDVSVVGYSFGGSLAVGFAGIAPWVVRDVVLLGPVGVMDLMGKGGMGEGLRGRVFGDAGEYGKGEGETRREVLAWLEGGNDSEQKGHVPMVEVGWEERARRGEVVSEALRRWEVERHPGFEWSVLSLFREGGVVGCEEGFRMLAELGKAGWEGRQVRTKIVLGEKDDCCEEEKVRGLGLDDVVVLEGAEHDFPRTRVPDVAKILLDFWNEEGKV